MDGIDYKDSTGKIHPPITRLEKDRTVPGRVVIGFYRRDGEKRYSCFKELDIASTAYYSRVPSITKDSGHYVFKFRKANLATPFDTIFRPNQVTAKGLLYDLYEIPNITSRDRPLYKDERQRPQFTNPNTRNPRGIIFQQYGPNHRTPADDKFQLRVEYTSRHLMEPTSILTDYYSSDLWNYVLLGNQHYTEDNRDFLPGQNLNVGALFIFSKRLVHNPKGAHAEYASEFNSGSNPHFVLINDELNLRFDLDGDAVEVKSEHNHTEEVVRLQKDIYDRLKKIILSLESEGGQLLPECPRKMGNKGEFETYNDWYNWVKTTHKLASDTLPSQRRLRRGRDLTSEYHDPKKCAFANPAELPRP